MSILPVASFLGKLEITQVFEYYDKPVLFACRNAAQTMYLVVLIAESDQSSTWLYVALSSERFMQIKQDKIDLHMAFKQAEDELVYEVTIFPNHHPAQLRVLPVSALSDDVLPEAGEYLALPQDDQQSAIS